MMMIPATTLKIVRREARNAPTSVADAPRAINTTEKPITKATAFRMTRAISAPSPLARNSSIEAPESIETYPGTKGSTQGERNETTPATRAMGKLN
jgi:hypothetical protein